MEKDIRKYVMKVCQSCGRLVPAARFCLQCGTNNEDLSTDLPATFCFKCRRVVAEGNYCGNCGAQLERK